MGALKVQPRVKRHAGSQKNSLHDLTRHKYHQTKIPKR